MGLTTKIDIHVDSHLGTKYIYIYIFRLMLLISLMVKKKIFSCCSNRPLHDVCILSFDKNLLCHLNVYSLKSSKDQSYKSECVIFHKTVLYLILHNNALVSVSLYGCICTLMCVYQCNCVCVFMCVLLHWIIALCK